MTTPFGLTTTFAYEPHRDIKTQVKNQFGPTTVSQYDYSYDALGQRTSVKNSGSAFGSPAFNTFDYNLRNELSESARYLGTDVAVLTNPVLSEYRQFEYDPIGNRNAITVAGNSGSYSTNNLNEYVSATLPVGGTNSFVHDADGNLTEIAGVKNVVYSYDAENRLISAAPKTPVLNDKKIDLTYDYQGRRVRKVIARHNGSGWVSEADQRFVYDGWNMIEQQTVASPSVYYVWGLDLSQSLQGAGGIGGLLTTVTGTMTEHFLYDGNGNVGQLINAVSGSLDAHYEYDAYGNEILATGSFSTSNPFRFSTKYFDSEYGLYYYDNRYYSPELGRWLSRDPLDELGFETVSYIISDILLFSSLNNYAFAENNPTNILDLFGLAANWHHLLPQQFRSEFLKAGFDIDAKEFGWIVEANFHTGKNGLHPAWNQEWKKFFDKNPKAGKAAILGQLEKMKRSSKFKNLVDKGVSAKVGHKEWLKILKQARRKAVKEAVEQIAKNGSKEAGKKVIKKVAIIGLVFLIEDIRQKGLVGGVTNNLLDQVPYLGWLKMSECVTGDWILDKE